MSKLRQALRSDTNPRLVILAGGSGSRAITIALARGGFDVTRIVPAWDSGGSSKSIRERLRMLSIGDIRHALMTIAYGERRAGHVVRVFNTRLSDNETPDALKSELSFYVKGLHPSLKQMPPRQCEAILRYLAVFTSHVGQDFDLRNGSLGNFVLAGAYLAHGNDINAAISVFRGLCSINGNVWPASTCNTIHLEATLRNGKVISGQHNITGLDPEQSRIGISEIRILVMRDSDLREDGALQANGAALGAIARADALIFGPGSFYTSVLPHLLVPGISQAIASRKDIPKIFVGNMLECPETVGASLGRMLEEFCAYGSRMVATADVEADAFVTHAFANRGATPFQRSVGGRRYVLFDEDHPFIREAGIKAIALDFEDPWQRGIHDAALVASVIGRLSAMPISTAVA